MTSMSGQPERTFVFIGAMLNALSERLSALMRRNNSNSKNSAMGVKRFLCVAQKIARIVK